MDIYYNVYDREGNFKRKVLSSRANYDITEDEYQKGVSCFVIKDGKILFEKRSKTQVGGGLLDFCSGHIDNDETPKVAVIRELGEELGIAQEIAEKVTELRCYPVTFEKRQYQKKFFMTFFYLEIPNDIELYTQESEVDKIDFLSMEEAFDLIRNSDNFILPYDANMEEMLKELQDSFIKDIKIEK